MASHGDGVNPLRPYYIPPSIGDAADPIASTAGRHHQSYSSPGNGTALGGMGAAYTHKARDIFGDIDYKDYISEPSPSVVQSVRDVVDDLMWRYTSVLMAQPFEVAKTILQVRSQDNTLAGAAAVAPAPGEDRLPTERQYSYGSGLEDPYTDFDSDPDEPSYFTPNTPNTSSPLYPVSRQRRRQTTPSQLTPGKDPTAIQSQLSEHQLVLTKPDSILEVISQLWQREGAWGVWKGTNASFLYTVLQSLLENWSRSLLSALFNVPDLGLKDDVDRLIDIASPYPWASLFVAAAAAVATGLILAPLDLVRTRLIVTPTSRPPRRVLSILRSLPSYLCPPVLVLPTVLHSLVHPLLTLSTPLVLRTRFMIDRDISPVTFSLAKFCSSSFALFIKLPLETVLRRGQAAVASSPAYVQAIDQPALAKARANKDLERQPSIAAMETILPLGRYNGVVGTMAYIVTEEGSSLASSPVHDQQLSKAKAHAKKSKSTRVAEAVYRRGQGMEGLWRGWKVSWWGLVGLWTAAAVGGGGDGQF